jgi:hypothetical protein
MRVEGSFNFTGMETLKQGGTYHEGVETFEVVGAD